MNQTTKELLEATKLAIKQQPISIKLEEESSFFKSMLNAGLAGLILPYIDTKAYSNQFITKTNSVLMNYIQQDEKQKSLIAEIREIFQSNHIDFMFLKGTKLKSIYPSTFMRGMGDIDVLVRSDLDQIKALFQTKEIHLESRTLAHDYYHTKDGLIIEIHPSIHKDFNPKYQTYFKEAWNHVTQINEHEYTLNPTFEIVYLLYHLAKHIESSGIGLRSILDIGLYINHYQNDIDEESLKNTLESLHMTKFYDTMVHLNQKYFDIEIQPMTKDFTITATLFESITEYFTTSGTHGKGAAFNPMAPRLASSENKGKSKIKVLLRIVAPKLVEMKGMYPVLYRHPYLYPVMVIHRIFKLAIFKRKSSLNKIRNLNESSKKRTLIEQLFDDMGIY